MFRACKNTVLWGSGLEPSLVIAMYNTTKKGDPSHVISLSQKTISAYKSLLQPFNHPDYGDFSPYYM